MSHPTKSTTPSKKSTITDSIDTDLNLELSPALRDEIASFKNHLKEGFDAPTLQRFLLRTITLDVQEQITTIIADRDARVKKQTQKIKNLELNADVLPIHRELFLYVEKEFTTNEDWLKHLAFAEIEVSRSKNKIKNFNSDESDVQQVSNGLQGVPVGHVVQIPLLTSSASCVQQSSSSLSLIHI